MAVDYGGRHLRTTRRRREPWLVQLRATEAGFYSYEWAENLVGADIHNVDRIIPELQKLEKAIRSEWPARTTGYRARSPR